MTNEERIARWRETLDLLHTLSREHDDTAPIQLLLRDLGALRERYSHTSEDDSHDIAFDFIERLMCAVNNSDASAFD
jgi:hypothetical protein